MPQGLTFAPLQRIVSLGPAHQTICDGLSEHPIGPIERFPVGGRGGGAHRSEVEFLSALTNARREPRPALLIGVRL
jgi:hypothetical protein